MMDVNGAMQLVNLLDSHLFGLLPVKELQISDRGADVVDCERHAREFMESVAEMRVLFARARNEHEARRECQLESEIAAMEVELREKDALVEKQQQLIQQWKLELSSIRSALARQLSSV
eukprot:jgi/Mesen1/8012/ME000425S07200